MSILLKIVSGSLDVLKAEMKQEKKVVSEAIKLIKGLYKSGNIPQKQRETLKYLDLKKHVFYSFSKVQPIRVEGIIIDFRAIKAFEKKLKRAEYWLEKQDDKLVILYNEKGNLGRAELDDLSKHYGGFKSIPEAEIVK